MKTPFRFLDDLGTGRTFCMIRNYQRVEFTLIIGIWDFWKKDRQGQQSPGEESTGTSTTGAWGIVLSNQYVVIILQ